MGGTHQYAPSCRVPWHMPMYGWTVKVFTTEPTEPRNKEIADDVEPILG